MRKQKVMELTSELLKLTDKIINRFEKTKKENLAGDFYTEVMPFSNQVQQILDEWIMNVHPWIHEKSLKNLNFNQVQSTKDQLEKTMVQAFFPQTSRKHFTDSIHAIQFILNSILIEAEKIEE
jgi:predicted Ser/Thr protein kinase